MNVINPACYNNTINLSFNAKLRKQLTPTLVRDTIELSGKNNNKVKVGGFSAAIAVLLCNKNQDNTKTPDIEKCLLVRDTKDFDEYKKQLVLFLKSINYDKDLIEFIADADNREELDFRISCAIDKYITNGLDECLYDEELNITEHIENQDFDNELNSKIAENERSCADKGIPAAILSSKPDTDKKIKQIKAELNRKYHLNGMFFNNDLEFAKICRNVLEILKQNDIHYTGTIIATDAPNFAGICLDSSDGNCVILNPNSWQSTIDTKHLIMHEIIHSLQPRTLEFRTQIIPAEYKSTADNVSEYAKGNYAHEVHCELYVKKLLHGLNPGEEELFNFLGGTFLESNPVNN